MTSVPKGHLQGRLAFTPSTEARKYLEGLIERMRHQRGLRVRVTLREAFDQMMKYARTAEARENIFKKAS